MFRERAVNSAILSFSLNIVSVDTIDVGFILDGSESLGEDGFEEVKKFVRGMIDSYEISSKGTHVGIVEFSEKARVAIPFDKTYDSEELKRLVNETKPSNKKAKNADIAFELARKKLFSEKGGSRPSVPRLVIFVTSGKSTGRTPMKNVVEPFRKSGVRVYVVTIGNQTDMEEVADTVSDKSGIIHTDEPEDLPSVISTVVDKIGSDIKKSTNGYLTYFLIARIHLQFTKMSNNTIRTGKF